MTFWWWGGFGFGLWKSEYPFGPVWSLALGPVTILWNGSRKKDENTKDL